MIVALALLSPLLLRAEDARLTGMALGREGERAYAAGFVAPEARMEWSFPARAGIYEARVTYRAARQKGFDLGVNGRRSSAFFPPTGKAFGTTTVGKVELKQGENTASIERGWGNYDVASVEFTPSGPTAPPKPVPAGLSDPKADAAARGLWARLRKGYGRVTLSGLQDLGEVQEMGKTFGIEPAVLGEDLMDYSPSRVARGSRPEGKTERNIAALRPGQILTLTWHWNAPSGLLDRMDTDANGKEINRLWYRGFYTDATSFDVAEAMAHPEGEGHRLLVRDVDAIAVQLKKYERAGVPILFRPLHEAEGGWFWWGAKGPEPAKALYRMLRDRIVRHHGIHNLIWVWNSPKAEWYPGDDVVDVMSADLYPSDKGSSTSGTWDAMLRRFDGRKMLALAEFGGVPDVDRMAKFGVRWAWFLSWSGGNGPKGMRPEEVRRIYASPRVVSLPVKSASAGG